MTTFALDIAHYNAPLDGEAEAEDLAVTGRIPSELDGSYIRNGPNPRGPSGHWFMGDGMLHGVVLAGGRARRYANRWVRTKTFETGARTIGPDGSVDLRAGVSNTSVVEHAGRVYALVENAFPCEVTPHLDTLGAYDFEGRLRTPMTAHPKRCPNTGELHFFGYSAAPQLPALTYHRADARGTLVESREIDVAGRTMMHDFAITAEHVVFMDLPIVFDAARAKQGTMPYRWSDDYGARLGVMKRNGDAAVRWFEIEPCYVFHVLNAFEEDDRIVLDAARYPELWRDDPAAFGDANLHRWTIDLAAGTVREGPLDDESTEFPRVDESRTGLPYRYGYALMLAGHRNGGRSGIVKYDLRANRTARFTCDAGQLAGEFTFVPAAHADAEDDGWIMGYVYDQTRDASDLVIVDAHDLVHVARVHLPQRVPGGFHGAWLPARR